MDSCKHQTEGLPGPEKLRIANGDLVRLDIIRRGTGKKDFLIGEMYGRDRCIKNRTFPPHGHNFPHATVCVSGRLGVGLKPAGKPIELSYLENGEIVTKTLKLGEKFETVLLPGEIINVPKSCDHWMWSDSEEEAEWVCLFSHRDPMGNVTDHMCDSGAY